MHSSKFIEPSYKMQTTVHPYKCLHFPVKGHCFRYSFGRYSYCCNWLCYFIATVYFMLSVVAFIAIKIVLNEFGLVTFAKVSQWKRTQKQLTGASYYHTTLPI